MNALTDAQPPQPPTPPQENECCGNGCENCVWTLYRTAEQAYQLALAERSLQTEEH